MTQEILKLYMNQITSLKKFSFFLVPFKCKFYLLSWSKRLFKKSLRIRLYYRYFFHQLSQICHNSIRFRKVISDGLIDLISIQKNLKHLGMIESYKCYGLTDIINSLATKLSIVTIKLQLYRENTTLFSFINNFTNLQELELVFGRDEIFESFKNLQYTFYSPLLILKFPYLIPRSESLIKFLENNGKNLKEFYICDDDHSDCNPLNLAIAEFCPNLGKLSTGFKNNELETLKIVLSSCQYLESIKIWCGGEFLSEKEALEMIVKYSHKNMCEIMLYHLYDIQSRLFPEELESFFVNWTNRLPQKSLSLIVVCNDEQSLDVNDENMKIIEKYIKLGIVKKFKVTDFEDCEYYICPI